MYCCYCIDLDVKNPEVMEFGGDELAFDMGFFNAKTPLDLSNYDRRVFLTEADAEAFLRDYKSTLKRLDNKEICETRHLPAMLYKRRYIVQTLMGLKNVTYRSYDKKWPVGQKFNLHDQTYFLSAQLAKPITFDEKLQLYRYEFNIYAR